MKFELEEKLFVLAIIFGAAWLLGMFLKIESLYIQQIQNIVLLIIGAFLAAYKERKK